MIMFPQGWAEDLSNHFQDFAQIQVQLDLYTM